jgi:lambda family phage portal protein
MGFFKTTEEGAAGWMPPQEDAKGIERLQMEAEPGLMSQMPPGLEFQAWDPQHPNQAYRDFVKGVLHGAASGLDVCYHNLTSDLEGVNYSSARVGELDERDFWKALQQWLCEELHQRVYERWLAMASLAGQVQLPTERVADYRAVAWLPRGWAWVDPENELNAIEKAIQLGLTSRTIEAAAQGRDIEELFAELDAEQELAAEYGITIVAPVKGPAPGDGAVEGPAATPPARALSLKTGSGG